MIRFPATIAVVVLAFSAVPAVAQPKANDVQPDRIPFGTVYSGAAVEGSFQVFEPGTNASIPLVVEAPRFVKVQHKATQAGQCGPGNDFIVSVGKGVVIALGESLWWNWITEWQAAGTDNARLLRWLVEPLKRK